MDLKLKTFYTSFQWTENGKGFQMALLIEIIKLVNDIKYTEDSKSQVCKVAAASNETKLI